VEKAREPIIFFDFDCLPAEGTVAALTRMERRHVSLAALL
jgi:hypothetical protein